jgi:tape measure domain-containing protein
LAALGKIAGELDKASTAVNKIDTEVKSATESLADLARQSQSAGVRTNQLKAQLETETRTRDENNKALKESKTELRELDRLLKQVQNSQSRLSKVPAVKTPGVGLDEGLRRSDARASASVFLAADQDRINREIRAYSVEIERAERAVNDLKPAVTAAAAQQEKLVRETEKSAGALRRQREELRDSRTNLAEIRAVSDQANARLGTLAGTQDKVAAASARMAAQMAAAKARIDALSSAKTPTLASSQSTGLAGDEKALASQRRAMLEARREWVASQEAVKRLAQEIRAADQPTEELGAAFGRAQAQARLAAQEYDRQALALHRLGGAAQSNIRAWFQSAEAMRAAGAATGTLSSNTGAAVSNQNRLRAAADQTADGMNRAAGSTGGFRGALGGLYGESRQAMSMMQRLRSEVLSLVTAYVGLHAAINQIGGVVKAFQSLEAAQSRLGVVFNQDTGRVSSELSWLNSEAARLGITFQVLSDEYGKFAVAANAANFSAESTRRIFTSVAEAARVNKLSVDQMSGVFLALQQMISKGKVSSEELRRQLGDRLTGAFNIFADAIGKTTAELDEMMRKGEVIADQATLVKFAAELEKRFGPQLAAALRSTTTEIGRFQNELFNAQLRVAEGGFIDALTKGLRELNTWFASRDGRDFFLSLGQALGGFVNILVLVPQHLDLLKYAMLGIIGVRLGPSLASISLNMSQSATATMTFAARLTALRASVASVTASLMTMRGLLIGIRGLMSGVLSVMGGIPGVIATIALVGITNWMTGISDATRALDEHKRQIGEVQAAYARAGGSLDTWAGKINNVTESMAKANLTDLERQFREALVPFEKRVRTIKQVIADIKLDMERNGDSGVVSKAELQQMEAVIKAFADFKAGTLTLDEFRRKLDEVNRATKHEGLQQYTIEMQRLLDAAGEGENSLTEISASIEAQQAIVRGFAGEADEAAKKLGLLTEQTEKANKAFSDQATARFNDALKEIKKEVPELAAGLKELEEIDALNKLYQDAVKLARTMGEVNLATSIYGQALDAIKNKDVNKVLEGYGAGGVTTSNLIKKFEGFRPEPYWDKNAFRVGYGSDTVTLADNSIKKVVEGMKVSVVDANRDLARRIGEFQDTIKSEIGSDRFNAFTPEQQAALTSVAYNYGNLSRTGELEAFKTGTIEEIAKAIRRLATHNDGINAGRRKTEADIFEAGGTSYKLGQQQFESEAEVNKYVAERVETLREEAEARKESTRELEIQKELNKAEAEAKKQGRTLTEEQVAAIREATGARWDAVHAGEADKNNLKEVKAAVAEIVGLDQQRSNLLKEMALAQQQGDQGRIEQTKLQIEELNARIAELLPNAESMVQALGDEKMAATLQRVALNAELVGQKVRTAASSVNFLGLNFQQMQQLGQSFASGIAGVFDKFAQALANGEDAMGALKDAFLQFASDFLRQIAQMIIQQAVLNALQSAFPGMGFGGGGLGGLLRHQGGMVGKAVGGQKRFLSPAVFTNALRFHQGGIPGLKPNEVPAVLEEGEEVLTREDPRHILNGGGAAAQKAGDTKIINAFDTASFLQAALSTRVGEKAILNFVQANAGAIKGALG